MRKIHLVYAFLLLFLTVPMDGAARTLTDSTGRNNEIPDKVDHVICSGSGCLRLLTYLQAQDHAVAVDDIEARRRKFDARPYAIANPQFKEMPIFGQFRGHDNPELILTLERQPQVILKTYSAMGHDPQELQDKTGIPVVVLNYGDLGANRPEMYKSLRIMAKVMGREQRAEDIINYMEGLIADLSRRTGDMPGQERSTVYVGGVAFRGPHGFQSTEPAYPPFTFINAINLAYEAGKAGKSLNQSDIAKEKIVEWDPNVLFLDLATLQMGDGAGGLYELRTDPAYRMLTAVKEGQVYGLLPYNWYTQNFGSILANAYFIGKVLYPERFTDVDPQAKADEIYTFLVGKPVFKDMNAQFKGLAYKPVPVN
ncbi:iron ABC transporter substrate-binding protein [Pseudodesulfovibrio thermohalotolerans]|uniref:iron ABC transporter substrate-binding protein n=1 Tax=Pseudodesulfovibrio thermohalotolerans TaxID=2880651 RepID=UPI0024429B3B|nr:iron ABC transporter substrate-binding protein [Pseudodesulfovibrio thermohalotolerans]WFS63242.1 iron ABC transporter substrate-binding protein [Pseudodesulfovibrio thermohalotolerans]